MYRSPGQILQTDNKFTLPVNKFWHLVPSSGSFHSSTFQNNTPLLLQDLPNFPLPVTANLM